MATTTISNEQIRALRSEAGAMHVDARCTCGHRNGEHCGRDGLGACDVAVRPGELCQCDHFDATEVR